MYKISRKSLLRYNLKDFIKTFLHALKAKDNVRSGRPSISVDDKNIDGVRSLVHSDRQNDNENKIATMLLKNLALQKFEGYFEQWNRI